MPTLRTLTGDPDQFLGAPSVPGLRLFVEHNLPAGEALIDRTNQKILLGKRQQLSLGATGSTFEVDLIDTNSTDLNVAPGTLQWQVVAEYPGDKGATQTWRSGWFFLTGDADLSELATTVTPVVANTAAALIAEMEDIRDQTAEATGVPGAMAVTDADAGSTFRQQTDARYIGKGAQVHDVRDFAGVNAAGDVTAAIQAAADFVQALGGNRALFMEGDFAISGAGLTIRCALDADQATLTYTGTGTALTVGHSTATTFRRRYNLPRVKKAAREWGDGARGVVLRNLNTCPVWVPNVENFDYGLVLFGDTTGCVHNAVTLGTVWQCMKSLTFDATDTGWANQNTILGGRLQQTFQTGMTDEDTNSWQVKIGVNTLVYFNGNTFLGTSFEGDNPGFYRAVVNGDYNHFVGCRWETFGGPSRIFWGGSRNVVDGGYDAWRLEEVFAAGVTSNEIRDSAGAYIQGTAAGAQNGVTSAWTSRLWSTQDSKRAGTYNAGLGVWTPKAGRWRISAALLFSASTSGTRRMARLLAGGSTVIATAQSLQLSSTQSTQVIVQGTYRFNGTESLALQGWQDTGADLAFATTAGYTYLHAERIGP